MHGGDVDCERTGRPEAAPGDDASCALAELPPGARARVVEVVVDGAPEVARRLGDYEVCLRRAQAAHIRTVEAHR